MVLSHRDKTMEKSVLKMLPIDCFWPVPEYNFRKINKNLFALIVSDRGIWRWLFCYVLSSTSCKTVIYFVTMVGNVPWSKADNTPWSHTTVTPLPTMFKRGRQWKTMHGTMVNLLPGKEEKREKAMVALLFFIMATLEIGFGRSKAVGRKRSIWR